MPLVEVEDLVVEYGGFRALHGLSCTIDMGVVGLLGPNGAGKSTLIKTLLGFNRPHAGRVRAFGRAMPTGTLHVRQQTGYMPEREVSSPKVSAVAFLTYCGRLFGMTRIDAMERAHAVLNYVGLGESRYRTMETYSTGMLQRVKLAQALIHDPKLLLLDEPTNGLDPRGRVDMLELIRDIAASKEVAVVVSSHLLPDVEYVCESVIMVRDGRVVRQGRIDELRTATENRFVIDVRGETEAFFAALAAQGAERSEQRDGSYELVMHHDTSLRDLFVLAQRHGAVLRRCEPQLRRLEDAFLEAMEQVA